MIRLLRREWYLFEEIGLSEIRQKGRKKNRKKNRKRNSPMQMSAYPKYENSLGIVFTCWIKSKEAVEWVRLLKIKLYEMKYKNAIQ